MRASFISWGNTTEERDKLIMFVIEGANVGRHFFRTNVGNGSRKEDLDAHDNMRDEISQTVTGEKDEKATTGCCGSGSQFPAAASRFARICSPQTRLQGSLGFVRRRPGLTSSSESTSLKREVFFPPASRI